MKTAVILTGGIGTRMAPITYSLNKSLVPIEGRPALAKIVSLLELSDIQKIVILAGYLSWQVEETANLLSENLKSELIIIRTPPDYSPANRLLGASDLWTLGTELILIYCDNLISDSTLLSYLLEENSNRVLVQKRSPGNVNINEFQEIEYFTERKIELDYVELGYWRLNPQEFFRILSERKDLPATLNSYTSTFTVTSQEIDDYISISNLERYVMHRNTLRRTIFLDRDGVLVKSVEKGNYLKKTNEVIFFEENIEILKSLSYEYNVDFVIVTNQAGIEREIVTIEEVEEINQFIALKMLNVGLPIIAFYICPHHWDTNCDCRKPKTGMLRKAIEDFRLDVAKCLLIGDQESDIKAGIGVGIKSFLIKENFNFLERSQVHKEIKRALDEF